VLRRVFGFKRDEVTEELRKIHNEWPVVVQWSRRPEGPGIDSRSRRGFPWHLTVPCALGSTQPLKMCTRIIL
jgi:hypothetical protein